MRPSSNPRAFFQIDSTSLSKPLLLGRDWFSSHNKICLILTIKISSTVNQTYQMRRTLMFYPTRLKRFKTVAPLGKTVLTFFIHITYGDRLKKNFFMDQFSWISVLLCKIGRWNFFICVFFFVSGLSIWEIR